MTARLRYVLVCDGRREVTPVDGRPAFFVECEETFDIDMNQAGETRRLATVDGWTCNVVEKRPSGPAKVRDFCPEHKP